MEIFEWVATFESQEKIVLGELEKTKIWGELGKKIAYLMELK